MRVAGHYYPFTKESLRLAIYIASHSNKPQPFDHRLVKQEHSPGCSDANLNQATIDIGSNAMNADTGLLSQG